MYRPEPTPHRRIPRFAIVTGAIVLSLVACGRDVPVATDATVPTITTLDQPTVSAVGAPVIDPGDGGVYEPQLDPSMFVDVIDNPYLPMPVGARWLFEGTSEGEAETVEIIVTADRKEILGISAVVVRDTVTVGGELIEDTYDWFAQDVDGNVWYLGEDVKDYENGVVVSTAGSWTAGVEGAQPGIVMAAAPAVGDAYRQEFLAGEAEDMMEYIDTALRVSTPAGNFDAVVNTRDWTPLEPEVIEEKSYARGVGKVREEKVAGGDGMVELVEFELPS
ncbi:MAG TPA: hypothetical protein VES40_12715 [Ilumatobacteraceae bacterium]|nr:hypothetical protein [Ilumatobacteraceae bacterium]